MDINVDSNTAAQAAPRKAAETLAVAAQAAQSEPIAAAAPQNIAADMLLADLLRNFGFKVTPENLALPDFLLKNAYPVTEANLKILNQAFRLFGQDAAKITFFMDNDIRLTAKNAQTLEGFAEHKTRITSLFSDFFDAVINLPDKNTRDQMLEVLLGAKVSLPDSQARFAENAPLSQTPQTLGGAPALENTAGRAGPAEAPTGAANRQPLPDAVISESPEKQGAPAQKSAPSADNGIKALLLAAGSANEINVIKEKLTLAFPERKAFIEKMSDGDGAAQNIAKKAAGEKTENAPPQAQNAAKARQITEKTELFEIVSKLFSEKPLLKQKITDEFGLLKSAPQIKKALMSKFSLAPERFSKGEYRALMSDISEKLPQVSEKHAAAAKRAAEINDALKFMSLAKNNAFAQIPLNFEGTHITGELYVFGDGRKKNKTKQAQNALIALDMPNLGRFEAYITKRAANVSFQFRFDNPETGAIVKKNFAALADALKNCGFNIENVMFKRLNERFNLLSAEPDMNPGGGNGGAKKPPAIENIVFDERA